MVMLVLEAIAAMNSSALVTVTLFTFGVMQPTTAEKSKIVISSSFFIVDGING